MLKKKHVFTFTIKMLKKTEKASTSSTLYNNIIILYYISTTYTIKTVLKTMLKNVENVEEFAEIRCKTYQIN